MLDEQRQIIDRIVVLTEAIGMIQANLQLYHDNQLDEIWDNHLDENWMIRAKHAKRYKQAERKALYAKLNLISACSVEDDKNELFNLVFVDFAKKLLPKIEYERIEVATKEICGSNIMKAIQDGMK